MLTQAEGSTANRDLKNNHNIENVGVGGQYDYTAIYEDPTSPFHVVGVQIVAIIIGHLFTMKLVFFAVRGLFQWKCVRLYWNLCTYSGKAA